MKKQFVLYGIIGLVIFSFAFFGIYDVITMRSDSVAKIGSYDISAQSFANYVSQRRDGILAQKNDADTRKAVMTKAFEGFVLNEIVNEKLISIDLRKMHASVTKGLVAMYIANASTFSNGETFDEKGFKDYMQQIGTTEERFVASQIPGLEKRIFSEYISLAKMPNAKMAEAIVASDAQTRVVDIVEVPFSTDSVAISEEDIVKYYDSVKEQFTEPRKHIFVMADIDGYIAKHSELFEASEEDVVKFYNQEASDANTSFFVATFDDEAVAKKVVKIVKNEGLSLKNTIKNLSNSEKIHVVSAEAKTTQNSSQSELKSVQSLKSGSVSTIAKDGKNYRIIQVDGTKRDAVHHTKKDLNERRICENVRVYIEQMQGDFESGETFENIMFKYGIKVSHELSVLDGSRFAVDLGTSKNIELDSAIIDSVVNNDDTKYAKIVKHGKCSYAVYQKKYTVDKHAKALDEVRGAVLKMAKSQKALVQAKAKAGHIVDEARTLKVDLKEFAKTAQSGVEYKGTATFSREDAKKNGASEVFNLKVGEVSQSELKDKIVIYSLREIKKGEAKSVSEAQQKALDEAYLSKFLRAYIESKHDEYGVTVYRSFKDEE